MKKLLMTAALCALSLPAYAKTCGSANGTDSAVPGDASLFNIYDGSCSSDNQANDGDDLKGFLDKGGGSTFNGPIVDLSLTKNSSLALDQNIKFDALGATDAVGFTDGNGFANIKSTSDLMQDFVIDPIDGSIFGKLGVTFHRFDGLLFRGQFADRNGFTFDGPGKDTASVTLIINLSDGSQVGETFTGLKLNADDGVFGFDEIGTLPKGLFVDSIEAFTDQNHSWDQVKQIMFSVEGPSFVSAPELPTWAMGGIGFALFAFAGLYRRKEARYAL